MKSKTEIKVLKNFDGFRGELVEVIQRIPIKFKNCDRRGKKMGPDYKMVSYKGKRYVIFVLHNEEFQGYFISIDRNNYA